MRTDEAVGEHVMNLDIGLPIERLRQPVRDQLDASSSTWECMVLDAVNRRGGRVRVRVTLSRLDDHDETTPAAMLAMEVVDTDGGSPAG